MDQEKQEGEIHLMLTARADQLTCKNILEIAETVKKADEKAYLRVGPSQILLGLPRGSRRYIEKALCELGYECVRFLKQPNQTPTYFLF